MLNKTSHCILKGITENNYKVKTNNNKAQLYAINMTKSLFFVLSISIYLFECNKVGWIALSVVKNDKHNQPGEIFVVIDHRIIQNVRLLSRFLRRYPHSFRSHRVFPGEDFTEVHSLVTLAIRLRVILFSRVACIYSKINPFSIYCG